jgi:hypothetical protein
VAAEGEARVAWAAKDLAARIIVSQRTVVEVVAVDAAAAEVVETVIKVAEEVVVDGEAVEITGVDLLELEVSYFHWLTKYKLFVAFIICI